MGNTLTSSGCLSVRISPGVELPVPGRLCGQMEPVPGDHLSAPGLQGQVPGKLLTVARES